MSISQKIDNYYKNQIEIIKKKKNSIEKDLMIGSLVVDIGGRCISALSRKLNMCREKIKSCKDKFLYGVQKQLEFRGRNSITIHYPNIINDIEKVIEKYKNVDSHFKTETLYVSISPKAIIEELEKNYNYPHKFSCYNTIDGLLKKRGYKLHKIPKIQVLDKIPETDAIFENVNEHLEDIKNTDDSVAAISIDDKSAKKIGNISDNGTTRLPLSALDHDTNIECTIKPFGILDLKTNETFITCTKGSSTAEFKVECIEQFIIQRLKRNPLKKLLIFLDNGPENSGVRKLWLLKLVKLSIKYNIVIDLVYYPPYHSKYNKIERYWARLQMNWNKIITNTIEKVIESINKTVWISVKSVGILSTKNYIKGIEVSNSEIELINSHIIREKGLEKWSIVITPYAN